MCDSKAEGGRRCPCDAPEARAARRRAGLAVVVAPEGGVGMGGSAKTTTNTTWDPDALTTLARDADTVARRTLLRTPSGDLISEEDYRASQDRLYARIAATDPEFETKEDWGREIDAIWDKETAARQALARLESGPGTPEAAVRQIGAAVAEEAERRAGVTAAEIAAKTEAFKVTAKERLEESERAVKAARDALHATDQWQEFQRIDTERDALRRDRQWKESEALDRPWNDALNAYGSTKEYADLQHAQSAHAEAKRDAVTGMYDGAWEDLGALSQAYRQTLSELRPLGGEVKFAKGSHHRMRKSMEDIQAYFPTDWIDHGNRAPALVQAISRRAHYKPRGAGRNATVNLSADAQRNAVADADMYLRVGLHEMSHRFEDVTPGIKGLEANFLMRRTTDPETGKREPLVNLYGGTSERARPDNFVDAYVGKDYGTLGGGFTEVLSMGTESLFTGTHGGLVGAGQYASDTDMRAFVLGVFATSGRSDGD